MRTFRSDVQLEAIYADADRRLRQIVAFNVRAPQTVIEDACQTAWLRFTGRRDDIPPRALLPWLATTATREALRLVGRTQCEVSLDALAEAPVSADAARGPEAIAELRGRLVELRALTARQRRLIWLQGLGFTYDEMAAREQATLRTVERQVLRARKRLRTAG